MFTLLKLLLTNTAGDQRVAMLVNAVREVRTGHTDA